MGTSNAAYYPCIVDSPIPRNDKSCLRYNMTLCRIHDIVCLLVLYPSAMPRSELLGRVRAPRVQRLERAVEHACKS